MPPEDLHAFDRDIAAHPLGDGRYGVEISKDWWIARGPNGGYVGALLMRAILAEAPDRSPRYLTVHFPLPPVEGPAVVEVTVERAGRSASFVSARLVQEGSTKALALAALSDAWEGPSYTELEMPEVQPPETLPAIPNDQPGLPPMFANYRVAPAIGEATFSGGDVPRSGVWIRARESRMLDAPLVVAIMDAWLPVPFVMQDGPIPAPTLDLTVHFRASFPPPGARAEDWYLADFHSALARGGFFEEDGELWSAQGELLAQSRQLAPLLGPRSQ